MGEEDTAALLQGERGSKPYDLELMLRIYALQNLYNLADTAAMNEIIDSRAFSSLLMKGTIVDPAPVAAPLSTKNEKKERDPDAHRVKKDNLWHFGFKGHIEVHQDTGLVSKIETAAAKAHDTGPVPDLLGGTEEEVFGDSGYLGADQHEEVSKVNCEGKRIAFRINVRRSFLKKLPEAEQEKARDAKHARSSIRFKVEHVFAVVKGMFRYRKTRLHGLPKVDAQLHMLFALANLILADRPSVMARFRFRSPRTGEFRQSVFGLKHERLRQIQ